MAAHAWCARFLAAATTFFSVAAWTLTAPSAAHGYVIAVTVFVGGEIPGRVLSSDFAGLSYEKSAMSSGLFRGDNDGLASLFKRLGPSVLRIGANAVDKTQWDPAGPGLTAGKIAPSDIDRLADFARATGWKVIYGLNFATNTPAKIASEAAYASQALGDQLYGFEIGNEPDLYSQNGIRRRNYGYPQFLAEWTAYANAIKAAVPGEVLTGPASTQAAGYAAAFARDKHNRIELLTQHYYRADGQSSSSTMDLLLTPDPSLGRFLQFLSKTAQSNSIAGGIRLDEANSFYNGGASGVSDAFGSALWVVDFLFANALNGSSGVNLHGGGMGHSYTPIADQGGSVTEVRPEYYGLYLFSLMARGTLLDTSVHAQGLPLSAYAVAGEDGLTRVVILNKHPSYAANVKLYVNSGAASQSAQLTRLTGPSLMATGGVLLNGAPIGIDGAWRPQAQPPLPIKHGELSLTVPPASAILLEIHSNASLAGIQ